MIKAILFILILLALTFGVSQISDTAGGVSVTLNNYSYEVTLVVAILGLLAFFTALLLCVALIKLLIGSPKLALRASKERKKRKGFEAISQGLLSVTAGDFKSAERHARDAQKFMPQEPLSLLLTAQTHQLGANSQGAEKAFRAMLEAPATKLIGLKGLHLEAERRQDLEIASQIAQDAVNIAPSAGWAADSLLKGELARKDYDAALKSVDRQLTARLIDKNIAKRWRGLLLTAKAIETNSKSTIDEALGFLPEFAPTAAFAAQKMHNAGDVKKATRLLENAWKKSPHPLILESYKSLIAMDSSTVRLQKLIHFVKPFENSIESGLAIAKAALDANDFATANAALQPHLANPTKQVCLLQSEFALRENNDQGKAKMWLAKSLRARADSAWMGDGVTLQNWQAGSPISHTIDGVTWQAGHDENLMLEAHEITVETAQLAPPAHHKAQIDEVLLALPHPPDDPGPKPTSTTQRLY